MMRMKRRTERDIKMGRSPSVMGISRPSLSHLTIISTSLPVPQSYRSISLSPPYFYPCLSLSIPSSPFPSFSKSLTISQSSRSLSPRIFKIITPFPASSPYISPSSPHSCLANPNTSLHLPTSIPPSLHSISPSYTYFQVLLHGALRPLPIVVAFFLLPSLHLPISSSSSLIIHQPSQSVSPSSPHIQLCLRASLHCPPLLYLSRSISSSPHLHLFIHSHPSLSLHHLYCFSIHISSHISSSY